MITDTHAHLYYPELLSDIDDVLNRAAGNGVDRIIVPAVDLETSRQIIDIAEKHDMIYCAIGIHPCDIKESRLSDVEEIGKLAQHEKVVAIGETGLDYYWDASNAARQQEFFKMQIELAKSLKLPIVIHTRNSIDDAIAIVTEHFSYDLRGQFHCFSGNIEHLNKIVSMDEFYISFCGNVTYKNFDGAGTVKATPEDRLLSETDSPFLPPVPYRGKRNEPSYIIHTMEKISELKEIPVGTIHNITAKNANRLFFS